MTARPVDALRATPLFAALPEEDLLRVAGVAVPRRFGRKETIFREASGREYFFLDGRDVGWYT